MAQYYNLEQAAEVLGINPAELNLMRERGEVHAYRDSGNWKFKKEQIDALAVELRANKTGPSSGADVEESEDVLLSELELGTSDASSSGTVIGAPGGSAEESDIKLGGSDIGLDAGDSGADAFDQLDLTLDEDLDIEGSQISVVADDDDSADVAGGSALDLAEDDLEDDELVLGGGSDTGSGSGSDIAIGQDSGISLVDLDDSGLSLESEPLELADDDESLALGEDDMLTLADDGDATEELGGDDDFLLTPLEDEAEGEDDSESGSQVIALDTEGEEAAVVGVGDADMAPMLDADFGAPAEAAPLAATPIAGEPAPFGAQQQQVAAGAPLTPGAATLPEAPFGAFTMVGLFLCVGLLAVSGIMAFDLVQNMWSWNSPYTISSFLMDSVLGLLPS